MLLPSFIYKKHLKTCLTTCILLEINFMYMYICVYTHILDIDIYRSIICITCLNVLFTQESMLKILNLT